MIEVCCAIIVGENGILAVQRGLKSSHPMKWEFPGGKIERFESAEQCILREIKEELAIVVALKSQLKSVEFAYPAKQIKLIPFVCVIVSGEIALTEHIDKRWFRMEEWTLIDWAEADHELILKNLDSLEEMWP
jgi:ADP-ribose pyrophosphatase